MVEHITVDFGEFSLDDAHRLRVSVDHIIASCVVTASYTEYSALLHFLEYRIAKAEKTAQFVEPA